MTRLTIPVREMLSLVLAAAVMGLSVGANTDATKFNEAATPGSLRTVNDSGAGGIGHKFDPHQLTTGEYQTTVYTEQGLNDTSLAIDSEGEQFLGLMSGIDVVHPSEGCASETVLMTPSELKAHLLPLPKHLPSGAWQKNAPEGHMCQGEPFFSQRQLEFVPYGVEVAVIKWYGSNKLYRFFAEDWVEAGEIQNHPAMFVRPYTEAGAGPSYIAFMHGDNMYEFFGLDIRFDDLKAMAEAMPLT